MVVKAIRYNNVDDTMHYNYDLIAPIFDIKEKLSWFDKALLGPIIQLS